MCLSACSNGDDTSSGSESTACGNQTPPPLAEQLDTVNIIIETSGSMKGFMPTQNRQTAFQQQVDDLLANAEGDKDNIRRLRLFTAQNNIRPIGYDHFQSMLRQGLAKAGNSTPIPDLLSQIASSYSGTGQVSVFISDFIYSPPNERDRDYISNDIRRALAPLQAKGLAVAVYGFTSEFQGTFYPAGSKSGDDAAPVTNCCETEVPYYVWIIGAEPSVRLASNILIPGNAPVAMQAGFDRSEPSYGVIPGSGRSGSWYLADAEGKTIFVDNTQELRQGEVSFTVGLNLEALPTQYATKEYLSEHLEVEGRNGRAQVQDVMSAQAFSEGERLNAKDRQLLECYTHLVKIQVTGMGDRNSPIALNMSLPAQNPDWTDAWTTDDDRDINETGARTFALNEILEGLRALYPNEREAVFTLDLSIRKAN
ncbi:hypothetical protein [Cesiribacter sp. SM1]|uniref:hypothetical protein n=1 Tax=Cesiribacter sp. SM1 TaxID=2861196 RepID=UPI001CD34BCE|nr:hypothetical protein [Cesiribacter sp. SM1]